MIWESKDWFVALVAVGAPAWAFYALLKGSIVVPGGTEAIPASNATSENLSPLCIG